MNQEHIPKESLESILENMLTWFHAYVLGAGCWENFKVRFIQKHRKCDGEWFVSHGCFSRCQMAATSSRGPLYTSTITCSELFDYG